MWGQSQLLPVSQPAHVNSEWPPLKWLRLTGVRRHIMIYQVVMYSQQWPINCCIYSVDWLIDWWIDFLHFNTGSNSNGESSIDTILRDDNGKRIRETKMSIPYIIIVDIVRHNLGENIDTHVSPSIFKTICKYNSVELKFSERLKTSIRSNVNNIKQLFLNRYGNLKHYSIKVQSSECVSEEQFQQICEEEGVEKEQHHEYGTRSSTCASKG